VPAAAIVEALRDLWGPGLVFIALCAWLVRRALRAARNESILEEQRVRQSLDADLPHITPAAPPEPPPPHIVRVPPELTGADVRGASQEHLDFVAQERHGDVLWVRSTPTHLAWCERRNLPPHDILFVAQLDSGKIVARWQFG